eukprot:6208461-Pleurochrysis_carterae.AAC.1
MRLPGALPACDVRSPPGRASAFQARLLGFTGYNNYLAKARKVAIRKTPNLAMHAAYTACLCSCQYCLLGDSTEHVVASASQYVGL